MLTQNNNRLLAEIQGIKQIYNEETQIFLNSTLCKELFDTTSSNYMFSKMNKEVAVPQTNQIYLKGLIIQHFKNIQLIAMFFQQLADDMSNEKIRKNILQNSKSPTLALPLNKLNVIKVPFDTCLKMDTLALMAQYNTNQDQQSTTILHYCNKGVLWQFIKKCLQASATEKLSKAANLYLQALFLYRAAEYSIERLQTKEITAKKEFTEVDFINAFTGGEAELQQKIQSVVPSSATDTKTEYPAEIKLFLTQDLYKKYFHTDIFIQELDKINSISNAEERKQKITELYKAIQLVSVFLQKLTDDFADGELRNDILKESASPTLIKPLEELDVPDLIYYKQAGKSHIKFENKNKKQAAQIKVIERYIKRDAIFQLINSIAEKKMQEKLTTLTTLHTDALFVYYFFESPIRKLEGKPTPAKVYYTLLAFRQDFCGEDNSALNIKIAATAKRITTKAELKINTTAALIEFNQNKFKTRQSAQQRIKLNNATIARESGDTAESSSIATSSTQHDNEAQLIRQSTPTPAELDQICSAPLNIFKQSLTDCTYEQAQAFLKNSKGLTPFHFVLDQDDNPETREKIVFLFQHAKRLGLDPNTCHQSNDLPTHADWNNSPLHNCISYELVEFISIFLENAKKAGFEINLNIQDKGGKTPLIFTLKLGWAVSIEVIKLLITPENYNMADNSGVTPIMAACAMRRSDVAELLIQCEADRLELGKINFAAISERQQFMLSGFIHQQHPVSGKTLGHYAVMRSGTIIDQRQESAYQETILNILKSAGVDGLRDENARWNSIVTAERKNLSKENSAKGTVTEISYSLNDNLCGKVFLSSNANRTIIFDLPLGNQRHYFATLFARFSGISLVDSILKRNAQMLVFLAQINFDFSIPQKNGKTIADYIEGLITFSDRSRISVADEKYLFPLKNTVLEYVEKINTGKKHIISSFFPSTADTKKVNESELIIAYCGLSK